MRQPNRRPKIFRGSDGQYHCFVTVATKPDGTLDRRHIRGRTASDVSAKVEALEERLRRGGAAPTQVETVGDWLTHWVDNVVKPKRAWKTWQGYRAIVHVHLVPAIGRYRLDGTRNRLEPEHLDALYARLGAKLAPAYVRQIHRVLSKALKDAVRRGRAARNVCELVDAPTARRARIVTYSLDEAQAIIAAAADDPQSVRWLVGILLGLRQGETLGLRWSRLRLDADPPTLEVGTGGQLQRRTWEHGCADPVACARPACRTKACPPRYEHGCAAPDGCKKLAHFCPHRRAVPGCARHRGRRGCPPPCPPGCAGHARRCPQRTGGGLVFVDPKSEKGQRTLVVPAFIAERLRALREEQIRTLAEYGRQWSADELVFLNPERAPIDPRRDHEAWERLLRRAGVPDGRLHAARHFAGTLLVGTGTDISVVQELLGHADIRVTRGYVEVAADLKRQAVERAAAALFDGQLAALLLPSAATKPARE